MKKVSVKNPGMGRLAIANSSPAVKKGKASVTTNGRGKKRKTTRSNPEIGSLLVGSVAAAVGGALVTLAAGKLPLPTNPLFNILAKFGLAYGASVVAEKLSYTKKYATAIGIGGASVAASDALKIAFPALRTIFLNKPEAAPIKVITQTDAQTGEPVALADVIGFDELGDIVTTNERYVGQLGTNLSDIYPDDAQFNDITTPNWQKSRTMAR
jgi:hypothetical protein